MSLMEYVKFSAEEKAPSRLKSHSDRLEELKDRLQERLPANRIVELMRGNIQRAKNEIRSVCKSIFETEGWSSISGWERERLVEELLDSMFGFGPLEALLADDEVTEIMVNGIGSLFYEKEGCLVRSEAVFANDEQVRSLIDRILSPLGRRIDESSPMVDARLPQGHRVNAIIPPLSLAGPVLTIRKFGECILSIDNLVQGRAAEEEVAILLEWAVRHRKNLAVTGGTGSGKTTVLNALSCVISPHERIITIEDSAELKFKEHPHVVGLESRPQNAEGTGCVTIRELVINALRMRPDRIVVGECRGGEALDMLQAMNTGHDGSLTTLHANSPADCITRLTTLVRYAAELPVDVIEAQIASALDLVVHTVRDAGGQRFISELASVSYERGRGAFTTTYYKREPGVERGLWKDCPAWVDELVEREIASAEEVERWKQALSLPV